MSRRLDGLDRLRGAALVLMLVHHLTGWYGGDPRAVLPGWPAFAVTDVAAVAFTVTLGASVPLLLASRRARGVRGGQLAAVVLRRYGLLIPIGIGLRAAIGFDLDRTGVLETLGLCALIAAVVVTVVESAAARATIAAAVLVAAPAVERAAADHADDVTSTALTGTFPLVTYVGFTLVGTAVVPLLARGERRDGAVTVGVALSLATLALVVTGTEPDRYPTGPGFIIPGLAGTALLYAVLCSPRLAEHTVVGRAIARAGAHTFGVFIGHYGIYVGLRELDLLHRAQTAASLAMAVATTLALVWIAPRVPQPPWLPRSGWTRRRTTGADDGGRAGTGAAPDVVTARRG